MQTAKTNQVSFDVSREDAALIERIIGRAVRLYARLDIKLDGLSLLMDVTATHANGCPLKLAELADATGLCAVNPVSMARLILPPEEDLQPRPVEPPVQILRATGIRSEVKR